MDSLFSLLFVVACVWLFFRLFGRYILRLVAKRLAKRFGINPEQFSGGKRQGPAASSNRSPSDSKGVVPDDMGEYVDFEEVE